MAEDLSRTIDTDSFSARMRARLVRSPERAVLVARFDGSREARDAYTRVNCQGFGRVREFREYRLHLEKAAAPHRAAKPLLRGQPTGEVLRTQVFQLAGCNWRCWYCFVDDDRLTGDRRFGVFATADELLDLYLAEADPPRVIDLSGGQPDLVPEWCLWVMEALDRRGLRGQVAVWIDDNLSTTYLWRFLDARQRAYMAGFPQHTRIGCFKGFDGQSFAFNTRAAPDAFDRQFEIFGRMLSDGFNMYAYVTLTSPPRSDLRAAVARFVDRLQSVHPSLPLRTVPLKIHPFTATAHRMAPIHGSAMSVQREVYESWVAELESRFSGDQLAAAYDDLALTPLGAWPPGDT